MHTTAKIAAVIAGGAVAVVGAGLALASVGGGATATPAEASFDDLHGLTKQVKRLDSRSQNLQDVLGSLQQRSKLLDRKEAQLKAEAASYQSVSSSSGSWTDSTSYGGSSSGYSGGTSAGSGYSDDAGDDAGDDSYGDHHENESEHGDD
jgi:hypothetical protein